MTPDTTTATPDAPARAEVPRERQRRGTARTTGVVLVLLALGTALTLVSVGMGQLAIAPGDVLASVLHRLQVLPGPSPLAENAKSALWLIRFPRVALALLVGACLGVGGVLMQGVFGNPLAEPGVIGVSSGAALGACTVIVLGLNFFGEWTVVACAFVGALAATAVAYRTARHGGRTEAVTLILTGVAVNAFCGAGIALMTFLGDTAAREEIVFWQLGSLNGTRWQHVLAVLPACVIGSVLALAFARQLDLMSLGDRAARHLGVDVERLRSGTVVLVAILTGAAVAFCGIIAFVGLVVPHLLRMIVGPGHRTLVPASMLGGAVLLLAADLGARTMVPYADLPIGMLTALVGGPFFFYLIRRGRRSGAWA
ncbi:iron ABC transporter permease [Pseudactinotalea suaedae]